MRYKWYNFMHFKVLDVEDFCWFWAHRTDTIDILFCRMDVTTVSTFLRSVLTVASVWNTEKLVTFIRLWRKKTLEKENEEERPLFQTLVIVGCLYITAKWLKYFFFKNFWVNRTVQSLKFEWFFFSKSLVFFNRIL